MKTSTQVIAPSSTSSLRPSSALESLAKTSGLEKSTHVPSPLGTASLETSYVRSSAKGRIQAQQTSTQAAKPSGTFSLVPSTPGTHHAVVTKTSVMVPFLKPGYMGSSEKKNRLVLNASISLVLPLKSYSLLASSVKSSAKVAYQTLEKSTLMVSSPGTTFSALSYMESSVKTSSQTKETSTSKRMPSETSTSLQLAVESSAKTSSPTATYDEHIGYAKIESVYD